MLPEVIAAVAIIMVAEDGESRYGDAYRTATTRRSCAPSKSSSLDNSESRSPSPRRNSAVSRSRRASTSISSLRIVESVVMVLFFYRWAFKGGNGPPRSLRNRAGALGRVPGRWRVVSG